jgi:chaperonin GroEL
LYAREAIQYSKDASDDFVYGQNIVYKSCGKPFEQILTNAGYDEVDTIILSRDLSNGESKWNGYNIKTTSIVNMKEAGILDPTKVTRNALLNGSSIASTILLTECVIVDKPEDKKEENVYDPSQMMM